MYMQERFNRTDPDIVWKIVFVVVLLACAFSLVWMLSKVQHRRSQPGKSQPMSLYLRLQGKLGLPLFDRWRLWRVAKVLNIEHPTALMISEKLYDEAVQQYTRSAGRAGTRTQLASIRTRLFKSTI